MHIHIPQVVYWIASLASEAAIVILLVRAFARNVSARAAFGAATVLIVWWGVALTAGVTGAIHNGPPGLIGLAVAVPLMLAAVAFIASKPLRGAVDAIPLRELVTVQIFRLLGFMFLLRMAEGVLPPLFALPAGIGDMLTGAAAIPLFFAIRQNAGGAERSAVLWNVFGIVDLVVALTIGFLASTSPVQLFHVVPTTDAVTLMPTIMIPAFGVPLFLILHAIMLTRLLGVRAMPLNRVAGAA